MHVPHTRNARQAPLLLVLLALGLGWTAALGSTIPLRGRVVTLTLGAGQQPLAGRDVLLVRGSAAAGQLASYHTDAHGSVSLPDAFADESISGLYLLREQPSARHADGWSTRTYARGSTTGTTLRIDPAATLKLFNVEVSLEWQPGNAEHELADLPSCAKSGVVDDSYLADLATSFKTASAYLYDLTDGQMAFGEVKIHTGGEAWDTADIRVLASNDYRPTAMIGGIVNTPTLTTTADGSLPLTFRPGQIFLSRLWDSASARCGPWSATAGARTIVHEWLHYATNLWDEYQQPNTGTSTYCTSDDLPTLPDRANASSAMAYHYTASELWLASSPMPPACAGTDQVLVHHRSDWETLKFYFPLDITVPNPAIGPQVGPDYPGDGFSASIASAPATVASTSADLKITDTISTELKPQAYLVTPISATDPRPRRIVDQGTIWPDQFGTYLGVTKGDSPRLLLTNPVSGQRSAFPVDDRTAPALVPGQINYADLSGSAWRTELHLVPVMDRQTGEVISLQVLLTDCEGKVPRVQIFYCPAGGDCGAPATPVKSGSTFATTFGGVDPLPAHGYIYARDPESGVWTATWYQLAGGVGPAHSDGHVPLADGVVAINVNDQAKLSGDTATLYMPAQRCTPPLLPKRFAGLLGVPLEVQAVIGGRVWSPNDPPLLIRLGFDHDLATRLGLSASDLGLLAIDPSNNDTREWREVLVAGRNPLLSWLAAAPQDLISPLKGNMLLAVAYQQPSVAPSPTPTVPTPVLKPQVQLPIVMRR